jgi:hypothetical protein
MPHSRAPLIPSPRSVLATRRGILPLLVALLAALASAPPAAAQGTVEGVFHLVWRVAQDAAEPVEVTYHLSDDQGRTHTLELDPASLRAFGGPLALNRRRVQVTAAVLSAAPGEGGGARLRVLSLRPLQPPLASIADAVQSGSKPYATLLCRFAGSTAVPHPAEYYQAMLGGTAENGLDHYWREVSDGRIDMAGSVVTGWLDLPRTREQYYPGGPSGGPDHWAMVADCTRAADSIVDFRQFAGVNMQFSQSMLASYGGSAYVTADSVNRLMPMTWMDAGAGHATYAHEMGHSFGLPHSSGPYASTYDSRWDVMSYGFLEHAQHTIIYHKDLLGWIPAAQRYVPAPGSRQTLLLNRSAIPGTTADYQMVQIPLPGGEFYTVEVRRWVGYDRAIPDEGVIIHRVNPALPDRAAQVVDADSNYNTNDGGAVWLPGERFVDVANQIVVAVDASFPGEGARVTVSRSAPVAVLSDSLRRLGVVLGPYADTLRADGGTGGFTWAVIDGALPPGLALGAATGILSGTPTEAGSWSFTARALSAGALGRARFRVDVVEPVRITSDSVRPPARLGGAYADSLRAAGALGSYTWSVAAGGVPAGLALDGVTGVLSGTATQEGIHRFTVAATSATLPTLHASLQLVLRVAGPLAVESDSLRPAGVMGAQYRDSLRARGGMVAPVWRVTAGQLPAGVVLDSLSGALSGVAAESGQFRVMVRARSADESVESIVRIAITRPQLQPAAVVDQLLAGAGLSAEHAHFLDLLGNRNGRVDVGDVRAWLAENQNLNLTAYPVLQQMVAEPNGSRPAQPSTPQGEP